MNAFPVEPRLLPLLSLPELARLEGRLLDGLAAVRAEHARRSPLPGSPSTRSGPVPDAPAASKLAGPDRGGVSRGGVE